MKKLISILCGLALFFVFVTTVSAATVGTNGDFETGTDPGMYTTLTTPISTITDWSVDSGSVDYIGTYWTGSNGPRSVDMNGLAAGSVSQTITTVVDATYNVAFDLSGNPDSRPFGDELYSPSNKVLRVSATGVASQDFSYDTSTKGNSLSDMKWEGRTYSFVATGTSTTLTFASQIIGAFGPALDNVIIEETLPTPTPVNLPTNKDQCKKGGWQSFGVFKNQGDCVSFVATGGKNLPAYR